MGPLSPNDHPAWSPPLGPSPWSGTTPATAQTPCGGTGEHLLRPGLPHPAGTLALDQPVSARRPGGAAAGTPAKPRPRATVDLVAAGHGQPLYHRLLVRPDAGRRPPARGHRGPSIHCAQPAAPHTQPLQVQRDADRAAAVPRTAQACPSGHLNTGHWTLDVRSTGWTDVPRRDRGGGQGNDQPGRRPDTLAPTTPAGRPDLTRVTAPGDARPPGRPRSDGTCAGALTAAATASCLAPPGMRPRPGALLSSDDCGSSVEPTGRLHPL
jgi:hypothetical protein